MGNSAGGIKEKNSKNMFHVLKKMTSSVRPNKLAFNLNVCFFIAQLWGSESRLFNKRSCVLDRVD